MMALVNSIDDSSELNKIDINNVAETNNAGDSDDPALKYAPIMPVKKGTYDLYPISLSWTDVQGASRSQLRNMANDVASTYARLSDDAIKFNVKNVGIYKTGVPRSADAVPSASDKARAMFTDRSSPYVGFYAIVNNAAKKVSHAGLKTASLRSPLLTTARHEVGHLLGLKHANRYALITSGKHKGEREFQSSRDGSSFMSIYSSSNLTAPQMYAMGWYKEKQVAMYEIGDPAITYNLQPVCNKENSEYINAVYIPKTADQPAMFLSMFETDKKNNQNQVERERFLAFHVGEKGGSTSLKTFKEHGETDYVSVDTLSQQDEYWQVRVGPTNPTNPAP